MNRCNDYFFKKNNIDFSKTDSSIYHTYDINEIVAKYEVQGKRIWTQVSVENIYGMYLFKGEIPKSFPEVFDHFFDEMGRGYQTRALGMLEYDESNVIDRLQKSFITEPMSLIEVDRKKYLMLSNGMHRFLVLRSLYLSMKSKCKREIDHLDLIKKYTIPVEVTKVDLLKTYCKYLINLFQPFSCMNQYVSSIKEKQGINHTKYYEFSVTSGKGEVTAYASEEEMAQLRECCINLECEYDENYKLTGKSVLKSFDGQQQVLTDSELISFTKKQIKTSNCSDKLYNEIYLYAQKYESFKQFLQLYFSDVLDLNNMEVKEDARYKRG